MRVRRKKIETFSFSLLSFPKDTYLFLHIFPPLDLPTDDPIHESIDRQVTISHNYSSRREENIMFVFLRESIFCLLRRVKIGKASLQWGCVEREREREREREIEEWEKE